MFLLSGSSRRRDFLWLCRNKRKAREAFAALLGLLPFIGGGRAALVGIAGEENAWPMAVSIFGFQFFAVLSYVLSAKRKTK
ncbi:hypothetical protein QNN00_05485 [Bacillus velezensis]|nr:hypothetical protein [Bacillus velezensis]